MTKMFCRAPIIANLKVAGLAAAYALTGWLGLLNAIPPGYATAVWPPSGIALAALLCWGFRVWPGIWIGSFAINVWIALSKSPDGLGLPAFAVAASIAVGSTLQALLGTVLLERQVGVRRLFDQGTAILAFAVIEALSCLLAATWGVTTLYLAGMMDWSGYFASWRTWWLGDLIGVLMVTPVLVAWHLSPQARYEPVRWAGAALPLVVLLAITLGVFAGLLPLSGIHAPLAFLPLPCLVWIAFCFDPAGVALASLLLSSIAVYATSHGMGPFARATTHESLMLLQAFMGLSTMTALVLAAVVTGQRRAEEDLRLLNAELERRVLARTTELRRSEEQLTVSLKEKEALLKEIHHRVKNNLQIIASLLRLQSDALTDSTTRNLFLDCQRRVRSMALLHEQLYQGSELASIDFAEYVGRLVNYIRRTYAQSVSGVTVRIEIPSLVIDIERAMPLGLIISELVSNSLQHAFAGADGSQTGELWVKVAKTPPGSLTLEVGDSGCGLPEGMDIERSPSMGLQLVHSFVLQLNGRIAMQRGTGAVFSVLIPE